MANWNQPEAIALARAVEGVCVGAGCHVALTGGCLYRDGVRKDCDLLFYRVRQVKKIDMEALWKLLETIGLKKKSGCGWCYKAEYRGAPVDIFFPEESGNGGDSHSGHHEA